MGGVLINKDTAAFTPTTGRQPGPRLPTLTNITNASFSDLLDDDDDDSDFDFASSAGLSSECSRSFLLL